MVSNYSFVDQDDLAYINDINLKDGVLILDDNILTGRTLKKIVNVLQNRSINRIYFGCVTYSGMKRYPQMIMERHGVINPDVLRWSCVVDESPYTKITSSHSYKNIISTEFLIRLDINFRDVCKTVI